MTKSLVFLFLGLTMASNEESLQEFAEANNLFAVSVYKDISKDNNENFLLSPYSAEAILALTQSGSRGDTAEEFRTSLHLPQDKNKIEDGVKASIPLLTGNDRYTLRTANKIYVKNGFNINEEFKNSAVDVYGADIETLDFHKKIEAANAINKWVEDKTENKIKDLVDSNAIDPSFGMLLVNALYFKANWIKQFNDRLTRKENFYKTAKDVVEVDMMHQDKTSTNFYESLELNAKFLELSFRGGKISMVFVLPNEKEGLNSLEDQIDKVFLQRNFTKQSVNIAIPKFKVESKISFASILKNLGVVSAFDKNLADLSGIAGKPGDLVIGDVIQKTFIDVGEEGVEAAAATYVGLLGFSLATPVQVKNFIADHPFIFYIKANDFIIFAGRVLVPTH